MLETVNYFRTVLLELMNGASRDTETYLDLVPVLGHQFLQHGVGGQITPFGQTVGQIAVLVFIKIFMMLVDVEESVGSQTERLTDMKMEANIVHGVVFESVIVIY